MPTPRRIRRPHRARPQPSDHSPLTPTLRLRQTHLRIQMTDPLERPLAHPLAHRTQYPPPTPAPAPTSSNPTLSGPQDSPAATPRTEAGSPPTPSRSTPPPDSNHPQTPAGPSRRASSGIAPPPQNGSNTFGNSPSHDASISARASASTSGLLEFSHTTNRSRIPNNRFRSYSLSPRPSGTDQDEPTDHPPDEAHNTARQAANGFRDHHKCKVDGCPCRIDFSRADAATDRVQRQSHLDQFPLVSHRYSITPIAAMIVQPHCDTPLPQPSPRRHGPPRPPSETAGKPARSSLITRQARASLF